MYARHRFVQYAAVCHYRLFVYVSGVPDWVKPSHDSMTMFHQIHTQTDGNDIRPHTAQIYDERTLTDLNLVTA